MDAEQKKQRGKLLRQRHAAVREPLIPTVAQLEDLAEPVRLTEYEQLVKRELGRDKPDGQ